MDTFSEQLLCRTPANEYSELIITMLLILIILQSASPESVFHKEILALLSIVLPANFNYFKNLNQAVDLKHSILNRNFFILPQLAFS